MNMQSALPISDQYRAAHRDWARTDGRARELESMKDHWVNKRAKEAVGEAKAAGGDLSVAAAEREVKASQDYHDFIMEKERARTSANLARGEVDYLMMRHEEEKRK